MTTSGFKKPGPETTSDGLHILFRALHDKGMAIGVDDAARISRVFVNAENWPRVKRVRVLKALLARTEDERLLIEQLSSFLFLDSPNVSESNSARSNTDDRKVNIAKKPASIPVDHSEDMKKTAPDIPNSPQRNQWESKQSSPDERRPTTKIKWSWLIVVSFAMVLMMLWNYDFEGNRTPTIAPAEMSLSREAKETILNTDISSELSCETISLPSSHPDQSALLGFALLTVSFLFWELGWRGGKSQQYWHYQKTIEGWLKSIGPIIYSLDYPKERLTPLDSEIVREAAFHLSAPTADMISQELNVIDTVQATVRRSGQMTFKFNTWKERRPILFIEDVSLSMVPWRFHGSQIATALGRQGVMVFHRYMYRSPAMIAVSREMDQVEPLAQALAGLNHPELIVFSDAMGGPVDPITCPSWMNLLYRCTWIHPTSRSLWNERARSLAVRLKMVPATRDGLLRLRPSSCESVAQPRKRPIRSKDPTSSNISKILDGYREFLGEQTFRLLLASSLLDQVNGLTVGMVWGLLRDNVVDSPSDRVERLWELPCIRCYSDGSMHIEPQLRDELIDFILKTDQPLANKVIVWAIELIDEDRRRIEDQNCTARDYIDIISARLARQSTDEKLRRDAERLEQKLVDKGLGPMFFRNLTKKEHAVWSSPKRYTMRTCTNDTLVIMASMLFAYGLAFLFLASDHGKRPSPPPKFQVLAKPDKDGAYVVKSDFSLNICERYQLQKSLYVKAEGGEVQRLEAVNENASDDAFIWRMDPVLKSDMKTSELTLRVGYEKAQLEVDGFKIRVRQVTQLPEDWISIKGGSFVMGNSSGDENEKPVRQVNINSFKMLRTEVTVAGYRRCVQAGKCIPPNDRELASSCNWNYKNRKNYPINCVDWSQSKTYCEWIGGTLPSEAQWEYAARSGGKNKIFPWGDQVPTCEYAIMSYGGDGCSKARTWPVCSKTKGNTEQGLCDISGNVWEWVADEYHSNYDGAPNNDTPWISASSGNERVVRGGSLYIDRPHKLRTTHRFKLSPVNSLSNVGFRCAQDMK